METSGQETPKKKKKKNKKKQEKKKGEDAEVKEKQEEKEDGSRKEELIQDTPIEQSPEKTQTQKQDTEIKAESKDKKKEHCQEEKAQEEEEEEEKEKVETMIDEKPGEERKSSFLKAVGGVANRNSESSPNTDDSIPEDATIRRVRNRLKKVVREAVEILEYRDLAYFEPFSRKWSSTIAPQTRIQTRFGEVSSNEINTESGVIKCNHPLGFAYLKGNLIVADKMGALKVVETICPKTDEEKKESEDLLTSVNLAQRSEFRVDKIDLRGAFVDDDACLLIGGALRFNYLVKTLLLGGNSITDKGAGHLAEGIKFNSCLENLGLAYNKIGSEGSNALATVVGSNVSLKTLDLSHNGLGKAGIGTWFQSALQTNQVLTILKLSHNKIGDEDTSQVVQALVQPSHSAREVLAKTHHQPNSTIHTLLMADTEMSFVTSAQLAAVIQTNRTITKLDISSNHFNATAVHSLANGLAANRTLVEFNFSHNLVSAPADVELIKAVSPHPTLKIAAFQECFEGSEIASELGQLLRSNSTLTDLDLNECTFEVPGIVHLCEAIAENDSITRLELSSVGLKADSVVQRLGTSLLTNAALVYLNLSCNNITVRGCKWLYEGMEQNPQAKLTSETLILEGNSGAKKTPLGVVIHSTAVNPME